MHDLDALDRPHASAPAPVAERETRVIYLGRNCQHEAVVDAEDYEFLTQWCWNFLRSRSGKIYARRGGGRRSGGKGELNPTILMHRVVCERHHGPRPSELHTPDHKNRRTLDNRGDNLRWATRRQQERNKGRRRK